MHIAGGLYQELCCVPEWNAVFGSGMRAAIAVSRLSPGSAFHAYSESPKHKGIDLLKKEGIGLHIDPRPTGIVFSYFHPLSTPHIEPSPDEANALPPLKVSGNAVLRFGFLEGDAIVDAERAVYDPQTSKKATPFGANGSEAEELAIVLNEHELLSMTGLRDIDTAALGLIEQGAKLVLVKRGVRGATVFEEDGRIASIPAYRSSRIFKIGTGDVFSAIFTHYWAEKEESAENAADIASRAVAAYCESRRLPILESDLRNLKPIEYRTPGMLLLLGDIETVGQRYTMEEARFILSELGVDVSCPSLGYVSDKKISATLILADGISEKIESYMEISRSSSNFTIILNESSRKIENTFFNKENVYVSEDFASSIYLSAWAAFESIV